MNWIMIVKRRRSCPSCCWTRHQHAADSSSTRHPCRVWIRDSQTRSVKGPLTIQIYSYTTPPSILQRSSRICIDCLIPITLRLLHITCSFVRHWIRPHSQAVSFWMLFFEDFQEKLGCQWGIAIIYGNFSPDPQWIFLQHLIVDVQLQDGIRGRCKQISWWWHGIIYLCERRFK